MPHVRRADQRPLPAGRAADRRRVRACWPGTSAGSWELPAFLYLGAIGVALAAIDIDTQRLPDIIVLPSYAVAAVLLGGAALLEHDGRPLVRAAARRRSPCTPSTSCWCSSTRRHGLRATSSSPASSACTSAGSAGVRWSSAASSASCSAGWSALALMRGRPGRPQDARSRTARTCCSGRSLAVLVGPADRRLVPQHPRLTGCTLAALAPSRTALRCTNAQARPAARRSSPLVTPITRRAIGGRCRHRERLASWQDDPPSVSTSGRRGCARPSSRSARRRSPSRSSARSRSPRVRCATARSSTPSPWARPSSSCGSTRSSRSKKVVIGVANQKVIVRQVDLPWLPDDELQAVAGLPGPGLRPHARRARRARLLHPRGVHQRRPAAGCAAACSSPPPARW